MSETKVTETEYEKGPLLLLENEHYRPFKMSPAKARSIASVVDQIRAFGEKYPAKPKATTEKESEAS